MGFNLRNLIGKEVEQKMTEPKEEKRIVGKIIKIDKGEKGGWGFISSLELPYTRIFFHWTSLLQNTLNFAELRKGMKVEFIAVEKEGNGWSALKIKVLEEAGEQVEDNDE